MTDEAEIDINIINQINYDSLSKSYKLFSNFDIGNNMKNSLSNSQIQFQINPEINMTEENEVRIQEINTSNNEMQEIAESRSKLNSKKISIKKQDKHS